MVLTDVALRHKARCCYLGRDDLFYVGLTLPAIPPFRKQKSTAFSIRCPSRSKAKVNCFLHAATPPHDVCGDPGALPTECTTLALGGGPERWFEMSRESGASRNP